MISKNALIICNMQNDYCENKCCEIKEPLKIIPIINRIKKYFDFTFFIKDWHPKDHTSFKENGGSWSRHCIQNSRGAELNQGLQIDTSDQIIHIGTLSLYDSGSAFYDAKVIKRESGLNMKLKKHKITTLYLCGYLLEESLFSTALDAINFRYNCFILSDISLGTNDKNMEKSIKYLQDLGIQLLHADQLNCSVQTNC